MYRCHICGGWIILGEGSQHRCVLRFAPRPTTDKEP